MKEGIVRDIVQAMTSSLDSEQLDKLKNVLYIKLVDVENVRISHKRFIA